MTIAGLYTIAELSNLIAAKDVEIKALADAYSPFKAQWAGLDSAAQSAWDSDYTALLTKYTAARAVGEAEIGMADLNPVPDADNPEGDPYYRAILRVLLNGGPEGTVPPGSLQDLWNRLAVAKNAPIPEPPVPQPHPGTDADLTTYQKLTGELEHLGIGAGPAGDLKLLAIGAGLGLAAVAAAKLL